jgi:hypothetical protein
MSSTDKDEPKLERKRRLAVALAQRPKVRQWCNRHHCTLRITNDGHSWGFYRKTRLGGKKSLAQWWPSTGKLMFTGLAWQGPLLGYYRWQQVASALERALSFTKKAK